MNKHLRGVKPAMLRILHTRFDEIDSNEACKFDKNNSKDDFDSIAYRPNTVTGLPSAGIDRL